MSDKKNPGAAGPFGDGADEDAGTPIRRKRRREIIAGAQRVFVKSGLSGARTRELAKEAGVSEATLFSHFATKEDLFDAAVIEPLQHLLEEEVRIARSYVTAKDTETQRQISMRADQEFLSTMQQIFPLLVTALFADRERGREFYKKHIGPLLKAFNDVQRQSYAGRRRKPLSPDIVAMMGVGAYFWVAMDQFFLERELDLEHTVATVTEIVSNGLFEN